MTYLMVFKLPFTFSLLKNPLLEVSREYLVDNDLNLSSPVPQVAINMYAQTFVGYNQVRQTPVHNYKYKENSSLNMLQLQEALCVYSSITQFINGRVALYDFSDHSQQQSMVDGFFGRLVSCLTRANSHSKATQRQQWCLATFMAYLIT